MRKKILLLISCLILPTLSLADKLTLSSNAPKSYIVKKGDTLWDISGVFLNEPWLWPKLWRINPEIENPHLIYPGDELRLVFDENGEPMLVKGKPRLKWSPRARTALKDQAPVQTISLDAIAPYIKYGSILTIDDVNNSPYVLGNESAYKSSVEGLKIYVNGDLKVGSSYAIYEKGQPIYQPNTDEVIAYQSILIGTGKAIQAGNKAGKEPSTIYVANATREIRSNSIVKPVNEGQLLPSFFTMQPANIQESGKIIHASSNIREFGKFEVVLIDMGLEKGVNSGDILSIVRQSPGIVEAENGPTYSENASRWSRMSSGSKSDYNMPHEPVGKMMVFRVYDTLSMAMVIQAVKPLRIEDEVIAP